MFNSSRAELGWSPNFNTRIRYLVLHCTTPVFRDDGEWSQKDIFGSGSILPPLRELFHILRLSTVYNYVGIAVNLGNIWYLFIRYQHTISSCAIRHRRACFFVPGSSFGLQIGDACVEPKDFSQHTNVRGLGGSRVATMEQERLTLGRPCKLTTGSWWTYKFLIKGHI